MAALRKSEHEKKVVAVCRGSCVQGEAAAALRETHFRAPGARKTPKGASRKNGCPAAAGPMILVENHRPSWA